ncbi:MAG: hypothetical protein JWM21_3539 [Acidobacteria bacterium]|nr:hypothetical protein [Acidobacteriota bacterium]
MSEEVTTRYHVRRREFLNADPDLPAFIIGIVEDTRTIPDDDPKQRWHDGTINLDLADCYRRVSFCFYMSDAEERANSLQKISLIAEVVNAVRDAIALEVESINARPAKTVPVQTETEPAKTSESQAPVFTSYITTLGL